MRLRVLADIPESPLSDIRHHPPPRLPIGRLKRSKIKKPPLAVKKPAVRRNKKSCCGKPLPSNPKPLPSPPQGRALKNYRYFHFIGVVRRHYRAFTRRSGYDVW